MGILSRLGIADCVICLKRVCGAGRGRILDFDSTQRLLRQLDSPLAVTDIPSILVAGRPAWLVHDACWKAHADTVQPVSQEREVENQSADCLVCRKLVGGARDGDYVDADFAERFLRLLGSPDAITDISSIRIYGHPKWLLHWPCSEAHAGKMQQVLRERYLESRRGKVATQVADDQARSQAGHDQAGARPLGGIEIVAGMSKQEVVRLLGEPTSKSSLRDFMNAQLSVQSPGGHVTNVEFWFFDVLPTPGQVLRVAFGHGRVIGIEDFDWQG